jgi:PIN domain nuclease of toxin-antitoxin system
MRYLLDTSVFLWAQESPERLNRNARSLLADEQEELFLSAASSWEISLKYAVRKLRLPEEPREYVASRMRRWGVSPLDITHAHALAVADLPLHHSDPFDRMLAAQAGLEQMTLLTTDRVFEKYPVRVFWCDA